MGASKGKNTSESTSGYGQDVWSGQQDALKGLYDQAANLFSGSNFQQFQDMAQNLQPYMEGIMNRGAAGQEQQLGGGAVGDTTDVRQAMMRSLQQGAGPSQMGQMYESIVGGPGNTYIDPMVDAMKRSSMQNLDRMQAGTGLDAAAAGQGGSSRHAMQNAMQSQQMNQDMLDREMAMRGGAYDKDLAMKMGIAQQADTNRMANLQNQRQHYSNLLGMADQNLAAGMGQGGNLMNLGMGSMQPGMAAFNMPWNALGQYSNVIGGPTVLGSGSQSGSSKGKGGGASIKG